MYLAKNKKLLAAFKRGERDAIDGYQSGARSR